MLRLAQAGLGVPQFINGSADKLIKWFMTSTNQNVLLITGSNGGIGAELARYFLQEGYRNIAFQYRNANEHISAIISSFDLDPKRHLFRAELDDETSVTQMRTDIEARIGEVWGLLNVAGGSTNALSWKLTRAEFQRVFDDNVTSTFLCCREFIPAMRKNASGRIINFSSIVGSTGAAGAAHYSAAKAAIGGWTKSLAQELAPKNITVNALALGYFNYGIINHLTPQLQEDIKAKIPLKRFGEGHEIGGYASFLLSPQGQYTNGQILHLNGGQY